MKLLRVILISFLALTSSVVILAEKPDLVGKEAITSSGIIGEWTCESYSTSKMIDSADDAWEVDGENLVAYFLGGKITFQDDGDSTYSTLLTEQSPFYMSATDLNVQCSYKIIGNILYIENAYSFMGMKRIVISVYSIEIVTHNKLIFKLIDSNDFGSRIVIAERKPGRK